MQAGVAEEHPGMLPCSGSRGPKTQCTSKSLLHRPEQCLAEILACRHILGVPLDQNVAKRAVALQEVEQEMPGCFHTTPGV
jgi:hypothetical protein